MPLASGTKIGPYEIRSPLGAGGMGEVYLARDTRLARDVAIKALPDDFANVAESLARFQREAQILGSLNHPNIAAIYGIEELNQARYLVLEYVPGETLAERIRRSPLTVDESLEIASQITEGLEAAHEKGVIHRDLKPANIKITPDGKVKVLEFWPGEGDADQHILRRPQLSHADGCFSGLHACGSNSGHGRVHVSRASPRQACGQTYRHLGAGLHPL